MNDYNINIDPAVFELLKSPLPLTYTLDKNGYTEFVKKMNGSDFANTPERYIKEHGYLKLLKESAKKYKLDSELKELEKRDEELKAKLKEFGLTVPSDESES